MFQQFLKEAVFSDYVFRSDFFPDISDRSFWNGFQNETCVSIAEAELEYGWPVIKATDFMEFKKSGNRKIMETIHFDRRNHLVLFALAELKENKGRFLPQIVNGLFTTCEETFWGLSAHWPDKHHELGNIHRPDEPYIDLFAAETAEHLAMIITLIGKPLADFCPEILDRVEYELERRIQAPYLLHRGWGWIGYSHKRPNNWNPWILSNLLTVFLLTEKNERRLHRALTKMFTEIQFYYDALPADGGCDEGPGYWSRAGASLFEFLYQLKQATDGALNLFDDQKLGRIAAYLKKVHVAADYFVNVADAHAKGCADMMPMLFGFAEETGQENLMNFSAAVYQERTSTADPLSYTHRTLRRLVYHSQFLRKMQDHSVTYPLHGALECLPDMELAVLRKGDMILSAKGGFNQESHNHNDVGSISLYDRATPVLVDVGISTYTRFTFQNDTRYTMIPWTQSCNHNLPLVNGQGQPYGKEFGADRFEATEETIEISFAGAYPPEAGVDRLIRTVTLDENRMDCTDRFFFADQSSRKVTEVLMSVLPVRVDGNTAILGERYRLRADCGSIHTEFMPFEDANLQSDWKCDGVTRITFSAEDAECITITVET
ncbi:MAG: heparinase II/III family protein [Clostridia bacterium]|nr:heparinase II/III family protein [Clostridia bacterium]